MESMIIGKAIDLSQIIKDIFTAKTKEQLLQIKKKLYRIIKVTVSAAALAAVVAMTSFDVISAIQLGIPIVIGLGLMFVEMRLYLFQN